MRALMHAAQRHACFLVQMVHALLQNHCAQSMHKLFKMPQGARKLVDLPTSNSSPTTALICKAHITAHASGLPFPSAVDTG